MHGGSLFPEFPVHSHLDFRWRSKRRRGTIAAAAYAAVFCLGAVLTAETVLQILPPFFVVGEGPTVIRQVVLSVSVTLLLTSALLMMTVYAERKTGFLLYSINALLLIGAGIVGVALGAPGSPLSWLGRAPQYLGDVYLAVASMKALGEARSRGTTVERSAGRLLQKVRDTLQGPHRDGGRCHRRHRPRGKDPPDESGRRGNIRIRPG